MSFFETKKLPAEKVRKTYDNLPPIDEIEETKIFGQERALKALKTGLDIKGDVFNVFVSGPSESGKTTLVLETLSKISKEGLLPKDYCYVHDFSARNFSYWISFPKGKGAGFKEDIKNLVMHLLTSLDVEKKIKERINDAKEKLVDRFNEKYSQFNLQAGIFNFPDQGHRWSICYRGEHNSFLPEEVVRENKIAFSEEERQKILNDFKTARPHFRKLLNHLFSLDKKLESRLKNEKYLRKLKSAIVSSSFSVFLKKYGKNTRAKIFLKDMKEDVAKNLSFFDLTAHIPNFQNGTCTFCLEASLENCPIHGSRGLFSKYEINLFVDNSDTEGAPVVLKNIAAYHDLFGRATGELQGPNTYRCDHTMILPGALHEANGGYLILKANDMLLQPLFLPIWQRLLHALKSREIRIESIPSITGFGSNYESSFVVEPIPLDVRVILIGNDYHYHFFLRNDSVLEFSRLFKIKAQMEDDIGGGDNLERLVGFIKYYCRKEGVVLPRQEALARIFEFSSEQAGCQDKLTLEIASIKTLLKEANHYANLRKSDRLEVADIERALEEKRKRHSFVEEKYQEYIEKNILRISVDGVVSGQINGLAVFDIGDYVFGKPGRILANVFLGKRGVVFIERETKTSGQIFDKGAEILASFFFHAFGQEIPLAFSASIGFEQQYGLIDGDSASCAELYTLLSVLADVGIRQGIAVTGSVDKRGNVQAIGGVNHKVKGFFDICKAKGLTGEQGVIIPQSNVWNLMLDKEIVQAVRENRFHIWAVERIEEGIEILTGVPYGGPELEDSVYGKVFKKLKEMAEKLRDFEKPAS